MTAGASTRRLRAFTRVAGWTVAAVTVWLICDLIIVRGRAADDAERIAALEERVLTDAEAAVELEGERQRQTERSLAREARNRRLGWLLLAASTVFLTGAKRLQGPARGPARKPSPPWPPSPTRSLPPAEEGTRDAWSANSARNLPGVGGGAPLPVGWERVGEGTGVRASGRAERAPTLDLTFVDQLVAQRGRDPEAAIPILQEIQAHYRYLPDAALRRVCDLTEITPARIAGVAGFYSRFRRTPVGEHMVRVCHGTACHVAGIEHVHEELRRRLGIPPDADTDPARRVTLDPVACLGCCSLAPVMMIGEDAAGHLTPATAWEQLLRRVAS